MPSEIALRVLRRFITGAEETKPEGKKAKRLVIMVGPPAAGKGFFVGEEERYSPKDVYKGKAKPEDVGKIKKAPGPMDAFTRYGWKFPESTHGLFKHEDVPDNPEYDESDNHLRFIQSNWADENFAKLKEAHEKGKDAFDDLMKGMWYDTKDGKRVELGDTINFENFPEDSNKFYKQANQKFYVSMRGWHDDAKHPNPHTGKQKERFKDDARHSFDDAINNKIDSTDKDMFIIDSAGEDIDAQDFKAQIERAKAAGYETSVVFLHPEKADTELSNLARGKVQGKRMVDQEDIDNWYEKNEQALKDIQSADPDNFLHYRKPPPDKDPAKAAEMRAKARELMEKLPPPPVKQKGEKDEDFFKREDKWGQDNKEALDQIGHTLYKAAPYPKDPEKSTSWGRTLDHSRVPEKPEGDVAKRVAEMNDDADSRYEAHLSEEARGEHAKKKTERAESKKKTEEDSYTRMDFLHEVGDQKVPNPNPKSRDRWPQVQIRSLDWPEQKKYYDKWTEKRKKQAMRVAARYMEKIMADGDYMSKGVKEIEAVADVVEKGLKGVEYEVSVKTFRGPTFFVTFKGGGGDTTEAKKLKGKIEKLVDEGIKKHVKREGVKGRVLFSTKGDDLLAEVDVLFP